MPKSLWLFLNKSFFGHSFAICTCSHFSDWTCSSLFTCCVILKIIRYLNVFFFAEDKHPRNDHNVDTGLMQQMSIFYAMGFSLMAQGAFSVCYHVCYIFYLFLHVSKSQYCLNSNCSNLLDMRNLQEQVKKVFCD